MTFTNQANKVWQRCYYFLCFKYGRQPSDTNRSFIVGVKETPAQIAAEVWWSLKNSPPKSHYNIAPTIMTINIIISQRWGDYIVFPEDIQTARKLVDLWNNGGRASFYEYVRGLDVKSANYMLWKQQDRNHILSFFQRTNAKLFKYLMSLGE